MAYVAVRELAKSALKLATRGILSHLSPRAVRFIGKTFYNKTVLYIIDVILVIVALVINVKR